MQKNRIVAIIQARMGSTRLPEKILKKLAGQPMLARVVTRCQQASTLDEVVIATTTQAKDDVIVDLCRQNHWQYFRGSEEDVLARYHEAAKVYHAEAIVRVTSDCPLIDPTIIDQHVHCLLSSWNSVDFVTNMMRQTFPLGLAVEALPFDVLTRMDRMSTTAYLREHVTTLAYEKPEWFSVAHICHDTDLSEMRWTVDTQEDFDFIRRIYDHFGHDRFSWQEVLSVLAKHPEWETINRPLSKGAVNA